MNFKCLAATILLVLAQITWAQIPGLEEPYRIKLADGSVLDVEGTGHAAPAYGDFDGDGIPDLLVGEFKDGALRIYRNHGTAVDPVFKDFEFFKVDGDQVTVPPS
jgi:hypothetical protein